MRFLAPLLLLVLTGCQQLPVGPVPDDPRELERWNINARFGYRTQADGGSANLTWKQRTEHGEMRLSGPLGFGSALISWQPGVARLDTGKEQISALSPAELAWRVTGVWLPVEALAWWVRGLAWPGAPADPEFNGAGELTALQQLGWELRFDRHSEVAGLKLPFRVRASRGDQHFTLIVRDWEPLQ